MGFGDYYKVGMRIGAVTGEPEDPYAGPTTSKGAAPSWWDMKQYREKAQAWWDTTTKTAPMIVEIKSNGVKLHSIPYDNPAEALAALDAENSNPKDYAYIAYFRSGNEAPYVDNDHHDLVTDKMFVPVTPIVHETIRTVTQLSPYTPPPRESGHAVAAGIGILGAIGLLALAAKAK